MEHETGYTAQMNGEDRGPLPVHGFMLFGGVIALSFVVAMMGGRFLLKMFDEGNTPVVILMSHGPLLLWGIIFMLSTGMKFGDLKISMPKPIDLGWAILLSIGAFLGALGILFAQILFLTFTAPGYLGESMQMLEEFEQFVTPSTAPGLLVAIIFLALIPAVVEEFLYRGLMMESFRKWGPVWAVVATSVAFGLSHETPLRIPSLIFVGLVLGWFRFRSGNLAATILVHFVYNSLVITLGMVTSRMMLNAA